MTDTNYFYKYSLFPSTFQRSWPDSLGSQSLAASSPPPAQAKDLALKANLKTRVQHAEARGQDTWLWTGPDCAPDLPRLRVRPQTSHRVLIPCAHTLFGKGATTSLPGGWHTLSGCCLSPSPGSGGLPIHV